MKPETRKYLHEVAGDIAGAFKGRNGIENLKGQSFHEACIENGMGELGYGLINTLAILIEAIDREDVAEIIDQERKASDLLRINDDIIIARREITGISTGYVINGKPGERTGTEKVLHIHTASYPAGYIVRGRSMDEVQKILGVGSLEDHHA